MVNPFLYGTNENKPNSELAIKISHRYYGRIYSKAILLVILMKYKKICLHINVLT
jgi:hypothetical protein